MTLRQIQSVFAHRIARLILKAEEIGYEITLGEAWRSPEEAARLARELHGAAIVRSLHCDRLAMDLNLFKDGIMLTASTDYLPVGMLWEAMSDDLAKCAWGGRFMKADGTHFSIAFQGRQ